MNLGARLEPYSATSDGELYPTFSSAEAERKDGLKNYFCLKEKSEKGVLLLLFYLFL